MSKKKKQQEAERLRAEQEAQAAKAAAKPRVVFRVMNNCSPVPVAAPSDFIQLPPWYSRYRSFRTARKCSLWRNLTTKKVTTITTVTTTNNIGTRTRPIQF